MMEKKIVLLICEGDSDKKSLQLLINEYLQYQNRSSQIGCEVFGCDFLFHEYEDPEHFAPPENVLQRVQDAIVAFLKKNRNTLRYQWSDILAVATLSDLDACYCSPNDVISGKGLTAETLQYDFQRKKILCNDVTFIRERNDWKKTALGILFTTDVITHPNYRKPVPFRAFYNNTNLEHVLNNNTRNNTQNEKMRLARTFVRQYRKKPEKFYSFLSSLPTLSPQGDYRATWNEYQLSKHAFDRLTNIRILIDWIESI